MLILNCIQESRGWSLIQHMIMLAAEVFDAQVMTLDDHPPSRFKKTLSFLQRKSLRGAVQEPCLIVCSGPTDILKLLNVHGWRNRFGPVGGWIIDSFWTEHIPRKISAANMFDILFVTSLEDVDMWRRVAGVQTSWLPWGTDALRLGSGSSERSWDLTRVGRQPPEWEDDESAAQAAARHGIRYRPRPASIGLNTLQNQKLMMEVYAATKYVLAFSNTVHREPYTHPTRQYLTGRWVDGLAGGAVLAGVPPKGDGVNSLLWKGATLDFGSVGREEGLQSISRMLPYWTPKIALNNYGMALRNLDWRWRFKVLADSFGLSPAILTREINSLQDRISSVLSKGEAS